MQSLQLEAWVARKVATVSRGLDVTCVRVVDASLPDDLGEFSPARVLEVVRASAVAEMTLELQLTGRSRTPALLR